jgi:hypothetical protein
MPNTLYTSLCINKSENQNYRTAFYEGISAESVEESTG